MGRIKTGVIKRAAKELLDQEKFSSNFDKNKEIVKKHVSNKKSRNQIAGYITKISKSNAKQELRINDKEEK